MNLTFTWRSRGYDETSRRVYEECAVDLEQVVAQLLRGVRHDRDALRQKWKTPGSPAADELDKVIIAIEAAFGVEDG